jgi:hypothetical protein
MHAWAILPEIFTVKLSALHRLGLCACKKLRSLPDSMDPFGSALAPAEVTSGLSALDVTRLDSSDWKARIEAQIQPLPDSVRQLTQLGEGLTRRPTAGARKRTAVRLVP